MDNLTIMHWVYLMLTIIMCIMLIRKNDITLFCVVSIYIIAFLYSKSFLFSIQTICRGIMVAFEQFLPIFIGISLIMSMTCAMQVSGSNRLLLKPLERFLQTPTKSYLIVGITMFIVSTLIWPSPAVALIGALLVPLASKIGLSPIYTAVAINIFGHGVALSGDFFIQGVPEVAARGAGFTSNELLPYLLPIWGITSIVTIAVSICIMRKDLNKSSNIVIKRAEEVKYNKYKSVLILVFMCIFFIIDIICMLYFNITGDGATTLISGTALIMTCIISFIVYSPKDALKMIPQFVEKGFGFSIKAFAPAVLIIAFFSLGNQEYASHILDEAAPGFIDDIITQFVNNVDVTKELSTVIQMIVGALYSLDGSGFAGLSVIGNIARNIASTSEQVKILTALGQVEIMWIGGGTLIPWSVIPVAAVCNVSPGELVRKNLIPVLTGLFAGMLMAIVMMLILV